MYPESLYMVHGPITSLHTADGIDTIQTLYQDQCGFQSGLHPARACPRTPLNLLSPTYNEDSHAHHMVSLGGFCELMHKKCPAETLAQHRDSENVTSLPHLLSFMWKIHLKDKNWQSSIQRRSCQDEASKANFRSSQQNQKIVGRVLIFAPRQPKLRDFLWLHYWSTWEAPQWKHLAFHHLT